MSEYYVSERTYQAMCAHYEQKIAALQAKLDAAEEGAAAAHGRASIAETALWSEQQTRRDAEVRYEQAVGLAQEMHDWIDGLNNGDVVFDRKGYDSLSCHVCFAKGYDADGLKHTSNCLLRRWRAFLASLAPAAKEG